MLTVSNNFRFLSLILTAAFFLINVTWNYSFYHLNSYKLLALLCSLGLLLPTCFYHYPKFQFRTSTLMATLFILSPIIFSFPGYLYGMGNYNYNFAYELAAFCMLGCWFMIVRETFQDQKNLDVLFWGIALLSTIATIHSFFQGYFANWGSGAIKASFGNRNYFAGYLIQTFPLFFSLGLFSLGKGKKYFNIPPWVYLITASLIFTTILLIRSRAGLGASFFTLFFILASYFYFKVSPQKRKKVLFAALSFGLLCVASYFILILSNEDFRQSKTFNIITFEGWYDRFTSFWAALESIKTSPLVGWGLGSSYNLYFLFVPNWSRLVQQQRSYNHVHSEPLEIAQEGGLLSVVCYLFFWCFIFYRALKLIKEGDKNSPQTALVLGLLAAFLAYHAQSLVSVAPRMAVTRLPLFLNLGLFFTLFKFEPLARFKDQAQSKNVNKAPIFTLIFFFIVACFCYIPWSIKQYHHVKIVHGGALHPRRIPIYLKGLKYNDIYTLHTLIRAFKKLGMQAEAKKAIDKVQKIIPHYQNVDYDEGYYYLLIGKTQKARESLLTMQKYDRFHTTTNRILFNISLKEDDFELWLNQFKIINQIALKQSNILDKQYARHSKISYVDKDLKYHFEIEKKGKTYHLIYQKSFLHKIYENFRRLKKTPGFHFEEAYQFISKQMDRHPFFKLQTKPGLSPKQLEHFKKLTLKYINLKNTVDANATRARHFPRIFAQINKVKAGMSQYSDGETTFAKIEFIRNLSAILTISNLGRVFKPSERG